MRRRYYRRPIFRRRTRKNFRRRRFGFKRRVYRSKRRSTFGRRVGRFRFRRRLTRRGGNRGYSKLRALKRVTDLLRRPQIFKATYGQQQSVGIASALPGCIYIITERRDATKTKDDISNVTLSNMDHLAVISDVLMKSSPGGMQTAPGSNETSSYYTDVTMKLVVQPSVRYVVRNQSTDLMNVTVYYCRARQDSNVFNFKDGTTNASNIVNLYTVLARGFAQNAIDGSFLTPILNDGMIMKWYSPFQSLLFTQLFKIYKAKRVQLGPGRILNCRIAPKPFIFRPHKYFELRGDTGVNSFASAKQAYNFTKHEHFCLFKIDSSPAGYGTSQAGYSKVISGTSPTAILESWFHYKTSFLRAEKTPFGVIETLGFSAQAATGNTIVNVEEGILGEEKDAE